MAVSRVAQCRPEVGNTRCWSPRAPTRHARLASTQKGQPELKLSVLARPGEDLGLKQTSEPAIHGL